MRKKIKLAFLINSLRFGGVEKGTVTRFNNFSNREFNKGLVYLKNDEHLLPQIKKENGIVWCPKFKKGLDLSGLLRLSSWIKEFQPDIILCVNTYPLFFGYIARLLSRSKSKLFVSFHSTALSEREDRLVRYIYRFFFNRTDRIIYVSTTQRAYWESRGMRRDLATVIHNGVDTKYFFNQYSFNEISTLRKRYNFGANDFLIGICAALRPEKQHEDLIKAIAILKEEGISAKCLVIGDGPRRAAIEENIAAIGLERDAVIVGFQADVRLMIAICDCMAIVSHQVETFSNAALESMAMGKPMVMSAIGGAAEQVQDGVNGYLFPAGDVEALAEALRKLVDTVHREELGKRAREVVVRDFGLSTMLVKYAKLFRSK
ncbi:MAG: glycosyltransferase [Candidatus Thiodiazotropha sp. (ex Lucinoma borealis)]|nr:glycosyltransferase [Candidatus Thiodiazotropha sp. (ex Lucinoma borealis)]MCU7867944.1 glycosyltransferase [Candidatus Thiodiazotropha sp. (ex Lucinoma borealis)]